MCYHSCHMGQTTAAEPTFSEWLHAQFARMAEQEKRPTWGVRTLAKRIDPDNPEAARRAINRHLHSGSLPTETWLERYATAFEIGRDEIPLARQEAGQPASPFRDGAGADVPGRAPRSRPRSGRRGDKDVTKAA